MCPLCFDSERVWFMRTASAPAGKPETLDLTLTILSPVFCPLLCAKFEPELQSKLMEQKKATANAQHRLERVSTTCSSLQAQVQGKRHSLQDLLAREKAMTKQLLALERSAVANGIPQHARAHTHISMHTAHSCAPAPGL